jgi:hypothetical protein
MALTDQDRQRIEEEEYRRIARERALQAAPPSPPSPPPATAKPQSTAVQTGLGAAFTGFGVGWLFIFPPLGIAYLLLGLTNFAWANDQSKRKSS